MTRKQRIRLALAKWLAAGVLICYRQRRVTKPDRAPTASPYSICWRFSLPSPPAIAPSDLPLYAVYLFGVPFSPLLIQVYAIPGHFARTFLLG